MARHRGTYKKHHPEPYEVSRSQIQSFLNCPACFWMNRVKGIKFPGMPGFLLNTATDTLLKKDFDKYRKLEAPHPFMERHGLSHLIPFNHPGFETWTQSMQLGLRTYHEKADFIIGGGLDDIWHDPVTDEIFIVDYKSTAGKRNAQKDALEPISLFGAYKESYKRQMDVYQWIMRSNGFNVSNTGYFLYVNGDQHFENGMLEKDTDKALMKFDVQLITYKGNDDWIDAAIMDIKKCLNKRKCPPHATTGFGPKGDKPCEYSVLFKGMLEHNLV
tara:strand:+ start:170 stop:988 length:819 start_codon:yes stop_codon:yes gene_type:complete